MVLGGSNPSSSTSLKERNSIMVTVEEFVSVILLCVLCCGFGFLIGVVYCDREYSNDLHSMLLDNTLSNTYVVVPKTNSVALSNLTYHQKWKVVKENDKDILFKKP
jgi:hypothetical protein